MPSRRCRRLLSWIGCLGAVGALAIVVPAGGAQSGGAPSGKIAFVRYSAPVGHPQVNLVRPGGRPRVLRLPGEATQSPAWSRDGRNLAFIAGKNVVPEPDISGDDVLYVSRNGARPRALTDGRSRVGAPPWSPGGERVLFARTGGGQSSLWVMSADGRSRRRLTRGHNDLQPSWSPDGRTIAFLRVSRTNFQGGIWLMRPDGSGARRILRRLRNVTAPVWSPGGGRLLITDARALYSVRPDGGDRRRIVRLSADVRGARQDPQAAWSPDGRWVVFSQLRPTEARASDIWIVRSDGSGRRRLTTSPGLDTDPSWAP
jgi:Tol biopolymer transport system component